MLSVVLASQSGSEISTLLLEKCGLWGCILGGVLCSNIAQYILTSNLGLRADCCFLSAYFFKVRAQFSPLSHSFSGCSLQLNLDCVTVQLLRTCACVCMHLHNYIVCNRELMTTRRCSGLRCLTRSLTVTTRCTRWARAVRLPISCLALTSSPKGLCMFYILPLALFRFRTYILCCIKLVRRHVKILWLLCSGSALTAARWWQH